MFEGDAKQLEKNIEYFMRYEQKKNRPLPIHHPSPITHHPSSITHHPSPITHPSNKKKRGAKNEQKPPVNLDPKKSSLGRYKKERESNWDPEGEQASSPLRGIKNFAGQK